MIPQGLFEILQIGNLINKIVKEFENLRLILKILSQNDVTKMNIEYSFKSRFFI